MRAVSKAVTIAVCTTPLAEYPSAYGGRAPALSAEMVAYDHDLDGGLFVGKLPEQAAAIGVSLSQLLKNLSKNVPGFVDYFCEEQGIDLSGDSQQAP